MSGMKSKRKGANAEREFAKMTGGRRVPLSGAAAHNGEEFSNDVILPNDWKAEVKRRAEMEKTLYGWILDEREKPDAVAFRADHKPWIVAMTLDQYMKLQDVHLAAVELFNLYEQNEVDELNPHNLFKAVHNAKPRGNTSWTGTEAESGEDSND